MITAAFGHTELAISNAIGGNAFEVLFLAFADIAYRDDARAPRVPVALTIAMTGVLLLGMLRREIHGFAGIGSRAARSSGCMPVRWR